MKAVEQAIEYAKSQAGKRNEVADVYNTYLPRPRGYKVKYEDMLCATYVSSIFIYLGWTDIVPPECAAWRLARNMEALDRYKAERYRVPDPGDLIFFGGGAVSTIGHVGIVTEVKGKQIVYYDINATVKRSVCNVGYKYISGYGCPDYAAHDTDAPEPKPKGLKAGDLVTINPGAKWYKGESIKLSCINDKWYIVQVKGDRAVLGMNEKQTRNVQSPIHTCDITLVGEEPATPSGNKVTATVTVDWETMQLLELMATGWGKTIGEVIDKLMEDAK